MKMKKDPLKTRIGIIAPASKIPSVELHLGIDRIQREGFEVDTHPQCRKSYLFFAGTDEERASALFKYALSPNHSVIWCARGGYGVMRILPILEKMTAKVGKRRIPRDKLLIGYSDITALMEFVRRRWGWATLHAPMPSFRKFSILGDADWQAMSSWIRGQQTKAPWADTRLTFWANKPKRALNALMVGGNLTVWNCLLGSQFQASARDSFLFLEDVDESLYRIDRMLQQLALSGSLNRVKGILLGNFLNCRDHAPQVLKVPPTAEDKIRMLTSPQSDELQPLRQVYSDQVGLQKVFTELGRQFKIPIAFGLPVGHGPEVSPMPLGAQYRLTPQGRLELLEWKWIKS